MSPLEASDAMTITVITVKPDTAVQEAVSNGISGIPVVDDAATLVGVISEGDLLRRAHEGAWPKAWGAPPRRGWARWLMDTERSEAEYITQHDVRVADIKTLDQVEHRGSRFERPHDGTTPRTMTSRQVPAQPPRRQW
jgi:CBS-domain-containing membrane protein